MGYRIFERGLDAVKPKVVLKADTEDMKVFQFAQPKLVFGRSKSEIEDDPLARRVLERDRASLTDADLKTAVK